MRKSFRQWIIPIILIIIILLSPLTDPNTHEKITFSIKFFIAISSATAFYFFQMMFQYLIIDSIRGRLGFLKGEKRFISIILMLTAKLVNADGKVDPKELKLVTQRLSKEFKAEETAQYLEEFESYLSIEISIKDIGKIIAHNFDDSAKTQLMYLLIGVATVDGLLSKSESEMIKKVALYAGIKTSSYKYIFKAFHFKQEQTNQKKSSQGSPHLRTRSSSSLLKSAYSLIGITENASVDSIKKAYRKLAKLHHPDKVAHLGKIHQERATEKFQLMSDAYELIKTKRGF